MVARIEELTEALTLELVQKHSRDEYTDLIKYMKAARLRKEMEAKFLRLIR